VLEAVGTPPFVVFLDRVRRFQEWRMRPNYSSENSLRVPLGVLIYAYYEE